MGPAGLSKDFGRPTVQHWTGLAFHTGPARGTTPIAATRDTQQIPLDADPVAVIGTALESARGNAESPGVHSTAVAIDPKGWQLVHFTLWKSTPSDGPGIAYQVLHLSRPGLDDLPIGRQW